MGTDEEEENMQKLIEFIREKQKEIKEDNLGLSINQVHILLLHIQEFLGPVYENCPQNLHKLALKAKKKVLREQLNRARKVLEKQAYKIKQEKKVIREQMEEDLRWRKQLVEAEISFQKDAEWFGEKDLNGEQEEQFTKLYQEDDLFMQ